MLTTKSGIFLSSFSFYQRFWLTNLDQVNGLLQERRNSIANALELRLSCTNPSSWCYSKRLPRSHEISQHFKCLQFLPFCQFYLSNLSYLCVWPGRMHQGIGPVQDEQWQILRGQFKTLKENNHQLEIEYYIMAHGLNEGYTTRYTKWPTSWMYTPGWKSCNKISIMKEWCTLFNTLSSGRCGCNSFYELIPWALPVKLLSFECQKYPLMVSQHWFRWWLGAIGHQAFT